MLKEPYISAKSYVHPKKTARRTQPTPALCLYTYIYIHAYTYVYIHSYVCLYISLQALAKNSCASPANTSTVTGPHYSTQDVAPATRACQKSPTYPPNSPVYPPKSHTYPQKSHIYPMPNEPYISAKEPYTSAKGSCVSARGSGVCVKDVGEPDQHHNRLASPSL